MPDIVEIAHHEAGHAVAALVLRLRIGRKGVTIIPDKITDALGSAHVLYQMHGNPELEISPRTHVRLLNLAVMCLAGDAAEKKFNPRRRFGAHGDRHCASGLLSYISSSTEILELQLKIAHLRACSLVNVRWNEIEKVATALVERKMLDREDVRKAFLSTMHVFSASEVEKFVQRVPVS